MLHYLWTETLLKKHYGHCKLQWNIKMRFCTSKININIYYLDCYPTLTFLKHGLKFPLRKDVRGDVIFKRLTCNKHIPTSSIPTSSNVKVRSQNWPQSCIILKTVLKQMFHWFYSFLKYQYIYTVTQWQEINNNIRTQSF